jgi:DNA excision repair protein ERCC-4
MVDIVVDTREQLPYSFRGYEATITESALICGDYSLVDHENRIAIERKYSIDELAMCLSRCRERFERELARAVDYSLFAVVIEGRFEDLCAGRYRSRMSSKAALATICAFHVRYSVPFLFAGNRAAAERLTFELLAKYMRGNNRGGH